MFKFKTGTVVSVRIVFLFSFAIAFSLLGTYLHEFLGDWSCNGSVSIVVLKNGYYYTGCNYLNNFHNAQIHWGYRHWLLFLMSLSLAIVQLVGIINYISKKNKSNAV